jgi:RNA polymerase sigma-70 factor (ECF subfamily)
MGGADQCTSRSTSLQAMAAMIAALPADQAEVIVLRVIAGLDVAEVAAVTGMRPGTVRVLTHRALRRLAQQLSTTGQRR